MENQELTAERNIEIVPFGTDERIKLNVGIVQKMIAIPTKQGHRPDAIACIKFMMLCKARHLNPFEGDAFLIGYDTQSGPQFSLITAHQVFLKRAEASKGFDGMESGVVVEDGKDIIEREGDITMDGERLIGGWAKVYRKDLGRPFYRRIKLSTFNTGRSRWEKDPAGMIVKCAEADALRSAFPTHLGGLYMQEELPPIDITPNEAKKEIQFGPAIPEETRAATRAALEAPMTRTEEEDVVNGDPPKKRHRRTKAEMEALREGQEAVRRANSEKIDVGGVEFSVAPAEQQKPTEAPPRATPLEGLRNLINAAPITEFQFEQYLIKTARIQPHQNLTSLAEDELLKLQSHFMNIANEIIDGK